MNPFKFGNIVEGEYFTNREKEIKEISSDIESGQNLIIISPRRYGKSSLINAVIKSMNIEYIKIDMELIADESDFTAYYIKKALSLSKYEKIKQYLSNMKIKPVVNMNLENKEISVSLNASPKHASSMLIECLEIPEMIAKKKDRRLLVVFDEFQEVRRISPMLERKMRGVFQEHQNVSYVFIGSQESTIREIFQNRKNPFYKFGRQKILRKIPKEELRKYVIQQFKSINVDAANVVNEILQYTECHPYYTQQLCHEIATIKLSGSLNSSVIKLAIEQIVNEHNDDYTKLWKNLYANEKKIITGISKGEKNPTSQDFLKKHKISSKSTAGSAVNKLEKQGILVRKDGDLLDIEDLFFREWVVFNSVL